MLPCRALPKILAIPRRYLNEGVHRYGFHGLSFAFQMQEIARLGDVAATKGRVILAHLGTGQVWLLCAMA